MFHKSLSGRLAVVLFGAIALSAHSFPPAHADVSKGPCAVTKLIDVPAKMHDGVTLLADVYRPIEAGSYPVILMRLPYDKAIAQTYVYASPEFYASHCYIVVIQDVRGQYASQGTFYPFRDEMNDGYDSVEWAAALQGSNGKVGMYGFSYTGATQWLAAVMRPPHLVAIVPGMTSSDYYDGWSYEGGAWSLAFEESWPISTIALVNARRTGDQSSVARDAARSKSRLVIGPYIHFPWTSKLGDTDFGSEATNPIDGLQLAWFDHWLKGKDNGADREAAVRVFVMGANRWRDAADWPIPGTRFTKYYLHSLGEANTRYGNGRLDTDAPGADEPPDRYRYDPANPVPSRGGHSCCTPDVAPIGPLDQAGIEERADVLVYSTPALQQPIEVTGPISVTLFAASSAVDTDWSAKLVDVHPDGRAINLNNGIIRARYRDSLEHTSPISPDQTYKYVIRIWPTSNVFLAGHKIRLEISSSNFPHYDRNPNTGHPFGVDAVMQPADQTVRHDAQQASFVMLPIIPEAMLPLARR